MANILTMLPTMADEQLKTLQANAERLETAGTAAQKKSAMALLPAIRAEITSRKEAALSLVKAKPTTRKKRA